MFAETSLYRGFKINLGTSTCVAAGTVVGAFIGALLTGVVTDVALIPRSETPLLTVDATSPVIKEPAGVFHNECASTQPLQIIHAHVQYSIKLDS